ncbi:SpaN/EivJ family type III secretion system needle length determinant [Pseudomonas citri]|uniref:SpaN/EivJ family type III secretion system needle length determinant n=1 Tax=Pseudomonas citri TaxID=2978349 RepID=UPI0021B52F39|nr:type III secretion effector protein [Pseudomonas citri]
MNEVVGLPAQPVQIQVLEPAGEGRMDELPDILVPVQEEDLPQGVLDLLATLLRSSRLPLQSDRWLARHAVLTVQGREDVQHRDAPSSVTVARNVVREESRTPRPLTQAGPLSDVSMPAPMPVPSRLEMAVDHVNAPTQPTQPVPMEPMEPTPAEPFAVVDEPVRLSPPSPPVARPVPGAVPASVPPVVMPPAPDVAMHTPPGVARGLLQVPFNNGAASGQVTIQRSTEESARQLTLNPSNAWVFEQLREPFAQAREPAWRLTDSGGEQPHQGSGQAPDDDQDETSERPA